MSQYPNDDAHLARLEEQVSRLADESRKNSEFVVETKQSLKNGVASFEDVRKRLAETEVQLRPNLSRIVTAVAGLLVFVGTAVWALSLMFGERPTATQLKEILETHAMAHHGITARKLDDHEEKLQAHSTQLERFNLITEAIRADIAEIKTDVKDVKRRGR